MKIKGKKLPKELSRQPLDNIWHKAVSKDPEEREDGREGLALLFLLLEDSLELKTDQNLDPLADLDELLRNPSLLGTTDESLRPFYPPGSKKVAQKATAMQSSPVCPTSTL